MTGRQTTDDRQIDDRETDKQTDRKARSIATSGKTHMTNNVIRICL